MQYYISNKNRKQINLHICNEMLITLVFILTHLLIFVKIFIYDGYNFAKTWNYKIYKSVYKNLQI